MAQVHILSIGLTPSSAAEQAKLELALAKLTQDDPAFKVTARDDSSQMIVYGMSEVQLNRLVERLQREHLVQATASAPRVVLRETIRKNSEGEGRYIRQTSGLGDYGHVKLRIEPNKTGRGFAFRNESKGGVVPVEYVGAVELGIREALKGGVLAGYEMVDIRVALFDGSFHELFSNEIAFRMAASMAFKDAARKANPVLLEPVMSVEMTLPEEDAAEVLEDLRSRHGRVETMEKVGGRVALKASARLANLLGYTDALRGLSQGRASLQMAFRHFAPCSEESDDRGEEALPVRPKPPRPRNPSQVISSPQPEVPL